MSCVPFASVVVAGAMQDLLEAEAAAVFPEAFLFLLVGREVGAGVDRSEEELWTRPAADA
jgi:hypothetical protein